MNLSSEFGQRIIEFQQVHKTFKNKKATVLACRDINLSIEKGDIFGVVGYSGAGKSTLIRMVNALERPTSGKVVVNGATINELKGKNLRLARKDISMIFQQFNLLNSKTVYENVAMPLILKHTPKEDIEKRVHEILEFVELSDKIESYPTQLSGGQMQRVGIARALATNPSILLCDEPTSALDPKTTDSILQLLKKINRELNVTIMIITHQVNIVQKICNRVAVMEEGYVVETGSVKDLFENPKQQITKHFVDTVIDQTIPGIILQAASKETKNYRILKVRCLDENIDDDFVSYLRNQFNIDIRTLFMSINEIQDSLLTVFGLQIVGEANKIDALEHYLSDHYVYERL